MRRSLRLSERWFNLGLWLIAVVFAGFLIGLGGLVVRDLPEVDEAARIEDFVDKPAWRALEDETKALELTQAGLRAQQQQAQLKLEAERQAYEHARSTYANWLAARQVTERAQDNPEVMARTRELDALQAKVQAADGVVVGLSRRALQANQALNDIERRRAQLTEAAQPEFRARQRSQELQVFGLRLAFTLPLLLLAFWLFRRHGRGPWWPFVWGFIFFAGFAFFVELVPYLPSYGGYVRHVVGVLLTLLLGRQLILALRRYLEAQREREARGEAERRAALGHDAALARLAQGVCPGCERRVPLAEAGYNFCGHCGLGLFGACPHCGTRKSTFLKFCYACGQADATAASAPAQPSAALQAQGGLGGLAGKQGKA